MTRGVVALAVVVGLVLWATGRRAPTAPEPVDVVWDHETCAECRMHLGDPRFAAQLHTGEGEVLSFDDPGCLFRYESRESPEVRARFFRDHRGDGWVPDSEVAFVRVDASPMGFDLGAVPAGLTEASAVTLEEARKEALEGRHDPTRRVVDDDGAGSHQRSEP